MSTERVCVVYEASTGEVRHLHHSVALPGAQLPSDQEIEERALGVAQSQAARPGGELRALHMDASDLIPHSVYRVDLKTLAVTAEPLPG